MTEVQTKWKIFEKYLLGQLLSKFVSGLAVQIVTFLLKMKDCFELLANGFLAKWILLSSSVAVAQHHTKL